MIYLLLVLVVLDICQGSVICGPPPSPVSISALSPANEFLKAHNKARTEVGVQSLKWIVTIAKEASLLLRPLYVQLWASGMKTTPGMAVEAWVEEKKYYNHTSNSCASNHDKCGVYTQVVWNKSIALRFAQVV